MGASTVIADGWGWRFGANPSLGIAGGSFTIAPGERVLLLGPSGSGKSTLLRAIAGVLDSDEGYPSGSLTIGGQSPQSRRGRVGLVLQDPESQTIAARVGDDVAFGCENLGVPREEIWPRVDAALEAVGLRVSRDHPTARLSGGQKQRLAVAGALAMSPDILLLDEPTANVDPDGARLLRDAVFSAASTRQTTLIVVDHNVDLWWQFLDRVIVLDSSGAVVVDSDLSSALTSHGEFLATLGVWLPDQPADRLNAVVRGATKMVEGRDLVVGRRGHPGIVIPELVEIHSGTVTTITGANGVGKSTLALTLGGLLAPVSGALHASSELSLGLGPEPVRWSSRQLARRIGNVFQSPEHQFVRFSVRDELTLGVRIAGVKGPKARQRVDELLERLRLEHHASSHPFTLSGGQKRRLSVGVALASEPSLLILDEPTFGQDAHTWHELVTMLGEVRDQNCAVVAATHDRRLVSSAQHILRIGREP